MSAAVESMMYVGETPWHGLGTKVDGTVTAAEAIEAAGLSWQVGLAPLAVKETQGCNDCAEINGSGEFVFCNQGAMHSADGCMHDCHDSPKFIMGEDVDHRAVVRLSDKRILGVVGPDWTPLQNVDSFAWFDPWVQQGLAQYHTAGSLHDGRIVWVLAKILGEHATIVEGKDQTGKRVKDSIDRYILLSNAHNGSQSARAGFTDTRVVCANTLAMAFASRASKLLRVRHTSAIKERLDLIRDIMQVQHQTFVATVEQYKFMAACKDISEKDVARYVRIVFFGDAEADNENTGKRVLNRVMELYWKGKGQGIEGVKGTLWAAYNAITQFLSWERGHTPDSNLRQCWFGDGVSLNNKAAEEAIKIAEEKLGEKAPNSKPGKPGKNKE